MAECSILPSNFNLNWRRTSVAGLRYKSWNPLVNFDSRTYKTVCLPGIIKRDASSFPTHHVASSLRQSCFRYSCLGTSIDAESATASDWVLIIDQVLLTASIFLTYMAGVIPIGTSYSGSLRKISTERFLIVNTPVAEHERDDKTKYDHPLYVVRQKLVNSLQVIEYGDNLETSGISVSPTLSLNAIADGARFRLILSCLQQLEKEINELSGTPETRERDDMRAIFCSIAQKACCPACRYWMEEQFLLGNSRIDEDMMMSMSEKLKVNDTIFRKINQSGKVDLFADLLYYLKNGSSSSDDYRYDPNLCVLHGVSLLEDLVIELADGIASSYLELISVDGDFAEKTSNLGFSLCTLSTRALQKLRNEIAMNQWFHQNVEAVVSMYEDRFDLSILQRQTIQWPIDRHTSNLNWWKKLCLKRSATARSLADFFVVGQLSVTVKRTKELRALTGWKYYLSLLLEASDVALPMVRAIVAQVRNAISFFLVSLIGRSVGLVYTGIRQSLRWK